VSTTEHHHNFQEQEAMKQNQNRPNFRHGEAFRLMQYSQDAGRHLETFEIIYNTRDGVTPFMVGARVDVQITISHVDWPMDLVFPYFVPPAGMRCFVDRIGGDPDSHNVRVVEMSADVSRQLGLMLVKHLQEYRDPYTAEAVRHWEASAKLVYANLPDFRRGE
jgi:hypothetical protein